MNTVRLVPETSIFIISGLVDPALARDFQDEWLDQLNPAQYHRVMTSPKYFMDDDHSVRSVVNRPELIATHRILQQLNIVSIDDTAIGINYQSPMGKQNFHRDNPTRDDRVYVVQGADGGAFDYSPTAETEEEAERSHLSIEVNAGDVLVQSQQQLIHRGRNASHLARVTAAIARVDYDSLPDSYR